MVLKDFTKTTLWKNPLLVKEEEEIGMWNAQKNIDEILKLETRKKLANKNTDLKGRRNRNVKQALT